MNQALAELRRNFRESLFTDQLGSRVLIYGTPEQAKYLYDTLIEFKTLDGKMHSLNRRGESNTPVDIEFHHSTTYTDDDIELGGKIAYVFQPRTKAKMDRVKEQFLHHLRIPDDVLQREINSVIVINFSNMTYRFTKL